MLMAAGLVGCAAKPSGGETVPVATSTPDSPSIYYRTQADADLALNRFGVAHPDCEVWTNWQKRCARTGRDGSAACQSSVHAVRPSTPFCAVAGGIATRPDDKTIYPPAQMRSLLRFCRAPTEGSTANGAPTSVDALERAVGICDLDPDRPFNGQELADMEHAWCRSWRVVGTTQRAVAGRPYADGIYCAAYTLPDWCRTASPMESPASPHYARPVREISPFPSGYSVNGVRCVFRR